MTDAEEYGTGVANVTLPATSYTGMRIRRQQWSVGITCKTIPFSRIVSITLILIKADKFIQSGSCFLTESLTDFCVIL